MLTVGMYLSIAQYLEWATKTPHRKCDGEGDGSISGECGNHKSVLSRRLRTVARLVEICIMNRRERRERRVKEERKTKYVIIG